MSFSISNLPKYYYSVTVDSSPDNKFHLGFIRADSSKNAIKIILNKFSNIVECEIFEIRPDLQPVYKKIYDAIMLIAIPS